MYGAFSVVTKCHPVEVERAARVTRDPPKKVEGVGSMQVWRFAQVSLEGLCSRVPSDNLGVCAAEIDLHEDHPRVRDEGGADVGRRERPRVVSHVVSRGCGWRRP